MATSASRGSSIVATTGTTWANADTATVCDGSVGTNPATYATWDNSTGNSVGTITIGGYSFSGVGGGDTINSVSADITHIDDAANRFSSITVQLQDSSGADIGSAATGTVSASAHTDTLTLGTPTAAQVLAGLRILVTATKTQHNFSTTFSLDYVDITVDYTAAPTNNVQFFAVNQYW